MKSPSDHIPFLDYLRGLAILVVFLFHCSATSFTGGQLELGWNGLIRNLKIPLSHIPTLPATLGWAGVSIFFVVSGFCIHLSHGRSRDKDLGIFFLRRFFRIYPPYLVALLVFALIFPGSRLNFSSALLHTHSQFLYSIVTLVSHLALLHNLSGNVAWDINGAFWSIAVEVQLYLLYPLLLVMANRGGWLRALWITGVIEIGLRTIAALFNIESTLLILNPLFFWFSWTMGAALAEAYIKGQPIPFTGRSLFFFPALLLLFYLFKPLSHFCFTLVALSTVYAMSYWLRNPAATPSSANRGAFIFDHLRFAGLISYSFYLIHVPILDLWSSWLVTLLSGQHLPYLARFTLCAVSWFLILVPAYLFYRFIELPSIAWGKRVIETRRQKMSPPASPLVAAES